MSNRPTQPPVETPGSRGSVDESHPAFGVAVVTRGSGTGRPLFQSDILHRETITLRIETAERTRDLNHDWVHPRESIVEVEMSMSQWGALVSSIGLGSGVPVTIRSIPGNPLVPDLPHQPRFQKSMDEARTSVGKLVSGLKETLSTLEDAVEGKAGIKALREALRTHRSALYNAEANSDFAVKSVSEAGEKVASQVRSDIEALVLNTTRAAGIQLDAEDYSVPEIEQRA